MKFLVACFAIIALSSLVSAGNVNIARAASGLHFLGIGDWGGQSLYPYTSKIQVAVADGMSKVGDQLNISFVMAMGDNFYELGVWTEESYRFQDTFEKVYTQKSLQVPWYVIAGNHDHYGDPAAELAWAKGDNRWVYPSLYHNKVYSLPGSDVKVEILYVDTIVLAGLWKKYQPQPTGRVPRDSQQQYAWIKQTLAASTADWIFVVGHYPVYSIAEHGPTANLIQELKPLMLQHQVSGYFCGHDHGLQHLKVAGEDLDYFLSGSASKVDDSTWHKSDVPTNSSKFYGPTGGFVSVSVLDATNAVVNYHNASAHVIYSVPVKNSKNLN